MTPQEDLNRRDFVKRSAITVGAASFLARGIGLADSPTASPSPSASATATSCQAAGSDLLNLWNDLMIAGDNHDWNQNLQDSLTEMFGAPPQEIIGVPPQWQSFGDVATDLLEEMGSNFLDDLKDETDLENRADDFLGKYGPSELTDELHEVEIGIGLLAGGFELYQAIENDGVFELPSAALDALKLTYDFENNSYTGRLSLGLQSLQLHFNYDPNDTKQDLPRIGDVGIDLLFGLRLDCWPK